MLFAKMPHRPRRKLLQAKRNRIGNSGFNDKVILVNAFDCRFQLWIADAFTRYTVQTAINFVCGYNHGERHPKTGTNTRTRVQPVYCQCKGTVGDFPACHFGSRQRKRARLVILISPSCSLRFAFLQMPRSDCFELPSA